MRRRELLFPMEVSWSGPKARAVLKHNASMRVSVQNAVQVLGSGRGPDTADPSSSSSPPGPQKYVKG